MDLQDEERLRRLHAGDRLQRADEHLLEVPRVAAHELDEHVVAAGDGGHVARLGQLGHRRADVAEHARRHPQADEGHQVEAELERVGDADDLEDSGPLHPLGPVADHRFGDAELVGDRREGAATVGLQGGDDLPVDVVERPERRLRVMLISQN